MTYKVGYIIGSISSTSINRRLAEALHTVAPDNIELVEVPIEELPFFSADIEYDYPQEVRDFKAAIEDADAVLFITPEYNRGIPGVLKNALDLASRPYGNNSFAGKPGAIIGTSGGGIATAVAQSHLRSMLGFLDVIPLGQPEAYIQFREDLLNEDNTIADESSKKFLAGFMAEFADHIEANARR